MSRLAAPLFGALVALALPATAQVVPLQTMSPGHDAARAVGDSIFQALDLDRSGAITQDEMRTFGALVFGSMDIDASLAVTRTEMLSWKDGLGEMAAYRGREQAHSAALGTVFDLFDMDGSADLSEAEHRTALDLARDRADMDRDGLLSPEEFRRSFIISVALRNAMQDPG